MWNGAYFEVLNCELLPLVYMNSTLFITYCSSSHAVQRRWILLLKFLSCSTKAMDTFTVLVADGDRKNLLLEREYGVHRGGDRFVQC